MEPIWTLLVESEEGVLLDELQENWNKRGFRLITEEQATSFSHEINGFLVQKASSVSQLISRTTKYSTINEQCPFLILLVGDEISHGLADQLHAACKTHPIEVVRLFLFPDQEHAVIGGDPSGTWVRILRQQLADEGVISQICHRVEADEAAACLPLYLEWKHRFYMDMGERCDKLHARVDVVAWALGMDKRIGQGWLRDKPPLVQEQSNQVEPISLRDWLIREVRLLHTHVNPRTIAVWSDERGIAGIVPEIEQLGRIRLYVTEEKDRANQFVEGSYLRFASPQESLRDVDALIILDVNPTIREIPPSVFIQTMRKPVILDSCSCYPLQEMEAFRIAYRTIGQKTSVARSHPS